MTATAFYLKATILKIQNYLKILFHIKFLLTFLSINSQKKKDIKIRQTISVD